MPGPCRLRAPGKHPAGPAPSPFSSEPPQPGSPSPARRPPAHSAEGTHQSPGPETVTRGDRQRFSRAHVSRVIGGGGDHSDLSSHTLGVRGWWLLRERETRNLDSFKVKPSEVMFLTMQSYTIVYYCCYLDAMSLSEPDRVYAPPAWGLGWEAALRATGPGDVGFSVLSWGSHLTTTDWTCPHLPHVAGRSGPLIGTRNLVGNGWLRLGDQD